MGAKIDAQFSMDRATFGAELDMSSIVVGDDLYMSGGNFRGEVDLAGARITNRLLMIGSKFAAKLDMNRISIGNDILMERAQSHDISMARAYIGHLDILGGVLTTLDLSEARIVGDLRLGSSSNQHISWNIYDDDGQIIVPTLTLENTRVGTFHIIRESWPDHLQREFEGFTYGRVVGLRAEEQRGPSGDWLIKWLKQDQTYSPQPYRQLADVLRAAGHEELADDILFANRDRERDIANLSAFRWWFLSALKMFIGYGYGWRYFRALAWVAALVVVGTTILYISRERRINRRRRVRRILSHLLDSGFYSLDTLLPVIHLRELHYTDWHLITWARYYFYIHKMMGYVLIFFVIAGLSGLTE